MQMWRAFVGSVFFRFFIFCLIIPSDVDPSSPQRVPSNVSPAEALPLSPSQLSSSSLSSPSSPSSVLSPDLRRRYSPSLRALREGRSSTRDAVDGALGRSRLSARDVVDAKDVEYVFNPIANASADGVLERQISRDAAGSQKGAYWMYGSQLL